MVECINYRTHIISGDKKKPASYTNVIHLNSEDMPAYINKIIEKLLYVFNMEIVITNKNVIVLRGVESKIDCLLIDLNDLILESAFVTEKGLEILLSKEWDYNKGIELTLAEALELSYGCTLKLFVLGGDNYILSSLKTNSKRLVYENKDKSIKPYTTIIVGEGNVIERVIFRDDLQISHPLLDLIDDFIKIKESAVAIRFEQEDDAGHHINNFLTRILEKEYDMRGLTINRNGYYMESDSSEINKIIAILNDMQEYSYTYKVSESGGLEYVESKCLCNLDVYTRWLDRAQEILEEHILKVKDIERPSYLKDDVKVPTNEEMINNLRENKKNEYDNTRTYCEYVDIDIL